MLLGYETVCAFHTDLRVKSPGVNHTPCPTFNPPIVRVSLRLCCSLLLVQLGVVTITTTDCVVTSNETRMACGVPEGVGFSFTRSVCVAKECSTTPHPGVTLPSRPCKPRTGHLLWWRVPKPTT
jgi:hypothetical protein